MGCKHVEYCKFHCEALPIKVGTVVTTRRKYTKSNAELDDDVIKVKFKEARIYIRDHKHQLNENMKAALLTLKGKNYNGMTEEQREQIIDIAKDMKTGKGK